MIGLAYAHSKNILHKDLKPENIAIDEQQTKLKIIDWGLSNYYYKSMLIMIVQMIMMLMMMMIDDDDDNDTTDDADNDDNDDADNDDDGNDASFYK